MEDNDEEKDTDKYQGTQLNSEGGGSGVALTS